MTHRENTLAILRYQPYKKMPVVAFGYWTQTLDKWAEEGHISRELAWGYREYGDNSSADNEIMAKLGFDFNWNSCVSANTGLMPPFGEEVLESFEDGSRIIRNTEGLICKDKPGTSSIPSEIGTSLTGRAAWEELYLPKLQMDASRVNHRQLSRLGPAQERQVPLGLHLGSLIGFMRNMLGVEELSYLLADDRELFTEIADTLCALCYNCAKLALESGAQFDYGHFWEDICFKNGPLVAPSTMREIIAPWYKKITGLLYSHGIDIITLDCDGCIDALLPIWLDNGVNTMFPVEVGTWNASLKPWREKYGRALRAVGGMDKRVFAQDKGAVDREVQRLEGLIALGGFIPCPDHRLAPDAKYGLVQYYCDKMQNLHATAGIGR